MMGVKALTFSVAWYDLAFCSGWLVFQPGSNRCWDVWLDQLHLKSLDVTWFGIWIQPNAGRLFFVGKMFLNLKLPSQPVYTESLWNEQQLLNDRNQNFNVVDSFKQERLLGKFDFDWFILIFFNNVNFGLKLFSYVELFLSICFQRYLKQSQYPNQSL